MALSVTGSAGKAVPISTSGGRKFTVPPKKTVRPFRGGRTTSYYVTPKTSRKGRR